MPRLEIINGSKAGASIDLGPGEAHEIGASRGAGVHLQDPGVDAEHARILDTGGGYVVVDLGSQSGTSVNGARLPAQSAHALHAGDEIVVGEVRLLFLDETEEHDGEDPPEDVQALLAAARAELLELREQLEELNEDMVAVSDERDQLLEELKRRGDSS